MFTVLLQDNRPSTSFFRGYIWRVFALGLLVSSCTTSVDEPTVSGELGEQTRIAMDVGLVVTDMDHSLAFYRDLLGLPVVAQVRTSLIGKGMMIRVQHGASLIKLLEMDSPPTEAVQAGITGSYGYRYVTLMVSDIQPFVSKIEQSGISVVMPLTELGNGAKIFMIEDPDGNIVELVEEASKTQH